ncbi:hypothetical protein [Herpetosiphon llansteffanensis]|uniref:hypothetical protein n=1 Tax=Herpetosiphon llansteffanensis TaxID=2094568 RepID=UPI000D7C99E3|nr:hypothetical protein [Herpetosiphon llansteffanensis]
MNKLVYSCRDIQDWLLRDRSSSLKPPTGMVDHIRQCALCRGALYEMVMSALELRDIDDISCDDCQDSLAAFVMLEYRNLLAAAKHYPQVWKHLLTCDDCSDTYEMLFDTVAAEPELLESEPWLAESSFSARATVPLPLPSPFELLLSMPRQTLVGLPTPAEFRGIQRSMHRGVEEEEYLLRPTAPYHAKELSGDLKVSYDPESELWTISLTFTTPVDGRIQATVGTYVKTIEMSGDKLAVFPGISSDDLISDHTDLILTIDSVASV